MNNYEQLLERVAKSSALGKDEIERRVEAKRAKLSGLISKEGAAQIVAAELGIIFDNERMKVSELLQGMKKANVVGKIIKMFDVREFNKNGREGKVGNFIIADDTGSIKAVLWDMHHIELVETGKIKEGDVVEISSGNMRNGEIHLSSFSDIKKSQEILNEVVESRAYTELKIKECSVGATVSVRANIVQIFEPKYFDDKKSGEKRAVMNIILDDGTETLRGVLFGEDIKKLGFNNEEIFELEKFEQKKQGILGEEKHFMGNMRMNSFFNKQELIMNGVEDVNVNDVIKKLEAQV